MTDEPLRQLGARLRAIRRQQHLTLHDVEERSAGEWKAVVVGSYERGDRAISVAKLARLAAFYGVPLHDLLPARDGPPVPAPRSTSSAPRLDLTALGGDDEVLQAVGRYVQRIQIERGDYNGRVLTVREDDLYAIALAFGIEPTDLVERLQRHHALAGSAA